jgi:5-methylcytosine-specific restriction endonuclease McrA
MDIDTRRQKRREYMRKYMRRWLAANREKRREYMRLYMRRRHAANREKERERCRKYYRENAEKKSLAARRRYSADPEKHRARVARYGAAHPDRIQQLNARTGARRRGAVGSHSLAEWRSLVKDAMGRCVYCGIETRLTRDHANPLCRGGTDFIANIRPSCGPCNSRKGRLTELEFEERRKSA